MIRSRVRKTTDSNIAVTNNFNLENSAPLGNGVKLSVDCLKQHKDLAGLPLR